MISEFLLHSLLYRTNFNHHFIHQGLINRHIAIALFSNIIMSFCPYNAITSMNHEMLLTSILREHLLIIKKHPFDNLFYSQDQYNQDFIQKKEILYPPSAETCKFVSEEQHS